MINYKRDIFERQRKDGQRLSNLGKNAYKYCGIL